MKSKIEYYSDLDTNLVIRCTKEQKKRIQTAYVQYKESYKYKNHAEFIIMLLNNFENTDALKKFR